MSIKIRCTFKNRNLQIFNTHLTDHVYLHCKEYNFEIVLSAILINITTHNSFYVTSGFDLKKIKD